MNTRLSKITADVEIKKGTIITNFFQMKAVLVIF